MITTQYSSAAFERLISGSPGGGISRSEVACVLAEPPREFGGDSLTEMNGILKLHIAESYNIRERAHNAVAHAPHGPAIRLANRARSRCLRRRSTQHGRPILYYLLLVDIIFIVLSSVRDAQPCRGWRIYSGGNSLLVEVTDLKSITAYLSRLCENLPSATA